MKKPRLTDSDRLAIETGLKSGKAVYMIAKELSRPVTTVHGLQMTPVARLRRAVRAICNRPGGRAAAGCAISRQCAATRRVAVGTVPGVSCGQPGHPLHFTA